MDWLGRIGRRADPRPEIVRPFPALVPVGGVLAPALPVVNVGTFAAGDGTDETVPIQQAIDAVPESGGILYFPPGTYAVGGDVPLSLNGRDRVRHCITMLGVQGRSSLQVFSEGGVTGVGLLEVEDCDDLTIRGLTFDANGWVPDPDRMRALVSVFRSRGVLFERNRVIDTGARGEARDVGEEFEEPHAVAFGFFHRLPGGDEIPEDDVSSRIQILDNAVEGFGLAAHHVRDVLIADNRVDGARAHAIAIGGEGTADGAIHENIEIRNNHIVDPVGYGIVVADITPEIGGVIRDVRIAANRVLRTVDGTLLRGIVVGALRDRLPAEADLAYERIRIVDNHVQLPDEPNPGREEQLVGIWLQVTLVPEEDLDDLDILGGGTRIDLLRSCVVQGNTVVGGGSARGGTAIVAHNFCRGAISGNGVYAISMALDLRGVTCMADVHDNRIITEPDLPRTSFFELRLTAGGNWLSGNALLGQPRGPGWLGARERRDVGVNGDDIPDRRGGG